MITALDRGGLVERRPGPADGRPSATALTPEKLRSMRDMEQERRRCVEDLVCDRGALAGLNSSLVRSAAISGKRRQCRTAAYPEQFWQFPDRGGFGAAQILNRVLK